MTTAYMIYQKVFIFNLDMGKKKSTIMYKAYRWKANMETYN